MISLLYVSGFGLLGVLCRYGFDYFMPKQEVFPYHTFAVNMLGCALAGCVYVLGDKSILSSPMHLGLLVGFCGGFTTFSAYVLQALQQLEKGHLMPALLYFGLSPLMGLLIAYATVLIARKII